MLLGNIRAGPDGPGNQGKVIPQHRCEGWISCNHPGLGHFGRNCAGTERLRVLLVEKGLKGR